MAQSKQRVKLGAILQIPLENGYFAYAQILKEGYAFFDYRTTETNPDMQFVEDADVLFFLTVYRDVIISGRWKTIGVVPIRADLESVPNQFIQDGLNPDRVDLYITDTGEIRRSSREEVQGLEAAAVWEGSHVEERLQDHYAGRNNKWVEHLRLK